MAATQKSRNDALEEVLARYRSQIAEMPAAVSEAASEHFEAEVELWESLHGSPLVEEDDFEAALVGALYPTVEELCGGDTYIAWGAVSQAIHVLALEVRELKRTVAHQRRALNAVGGCLVATFPWTEVEEVTA